jgi:hypothetical protein
MRLQITPKPVRARVGDLLEIQMKLPSEYAKSSPESLHKVFYVDLFSAMDGFEFSPHVQDFVDITADGKPHVYKPMGAVLSRQTPEAYISFMVDEPAAFALFQTVDRFGEDQTDALANVRIKAIGKVRQKFRRFVEKLFG